MGATPQDLALMRHHNTGAGGWFPYGIGADPNNRLFSAAAGFPRNPGDRDDLDYSLIGTGQINTNDSRGSGGSGSSAGTNTTPRGGATATKQEKFAVARKGRAGRSKPITILGDPSDKVGS